MAASLYYVRTFTVGRTLQEGPSDRGGVAGVSGFAGVGRVITREVSSNRRDIEAFRSSRPQACPVWGGVQGSPQTGTEAYTYAIY